MNLFARILKIDSVRREVHGVMAEDARDKSNEMFDYESSKPYVKAWSEDAAKRTTDAGQPISYGNVRAQHGNVAAGRVVSIDFDDANKCIPIVAKIVDDNEWRKVEEGVYTGFSIGGKYIKRWADGSATRYTAQPSEVSIVDNPCMYGAKFTMVKADGVEEERTFVSCVPDFSKATSLDELASMMKSFIQHVESTENPAGKEDPMDVKKFEELAKNVETLQKEQEVLKKMSAENQAHLHAMLIHHNGMGSHLQAMCESGKAAGIEVAKGAGETEAEKAAKAAELAKAAAAGAGNAELSAFKADVQKQLDTLTDLVKKLAAQPAPSGAVAAGHSTGEKGKAGEVEKDSKVVRFVPAGVEKVESVAEQEIRKALENGVPVDPRQRAAFSPKQ